MLESILLVFSPILFFAIITIVNRAIGLMPPLSVLSCVLLTLLFMTGLKLFDEKELGIPNPPGALDSIFSIAVPLVIIVIAVLVDLLAITFIKKLKRENKP